MIRSTGDRGFVRLPTLASVAYAIAKRDERLISPFANGITISGRFGNPKEQ